MTIRSCFLNPDWPKTLGWAVIDAPPEKELLSAAHGGNADAGPGVALLANRKLLVVNQSKGWRITEKSAEILANRDPVQIYALAEDA